MPERRRHLVGLPARVQPDSAVPLALRGDEVAVPALGPENLGRELLRMRARLLQRDHIRSRFAEPLEEPLLRDGAHPVHVPGVDAMNLARHAPTLVNGSATSTGLRGSLLRADLLQVVDVGEVLWTTGGVLGAEEIFE